MLLRSVPARVLGTNTTVLAARAGTTGSPGECLVVDPGIGVVDRLLPLLERLHLRPVAVVATHGHLDHVAEAAAVADPAGAPVLLGAADVHRLEDPLEGLGPQLRAALLAQVPGFAWRRPASVRGLAGGDEVVAGSLRVRAVAAPGHTEGSTLLVVDDVPDDGSWSAADGLPAGSPAVAGQVRSTVMTGDVLFAGSVGRTDLPGGDGAAMRATLRDVVLALPDHALVVPGHGPASTVARERATNPYLLDPDLLESP
ncbi:MBL fold metallo-hydrolase [Pseudokineococcus marinus]|uniref:MBL fold metallo-hydrolase n=1 Tax=Pseudokineococcus marinus TaxID=351215 RepID=A0A849BXV5_9ACTN|nr:MBL fold metallo-hydrolase [Pseudokineococcus marinus]NNH22358.1 MBL fold metallo-hydrolase [Pseudokineococcus marinus]